MSLAPLRVGMTLPDNSQTGRAAEFKDCAEETYDSAANRVTNWQTHFSKTLVAQLVLISALWPEGVEETERPRKR